jgi:hypothetical protein
VNTEIVVVALIPVLWVGLSVAARAIAGKPIVFFSVPGAVFQERTASGCEWDVWWRRFGSASNCLVVALTGTRLVIRPFTPFNLMLLPEVWGLEHDVPLRRLIGVQRERHWLQRGVMVRFRDESGSERAMFLKLRREEDFLRHVQALPRDGLT